MKNPFKRINKPILRVGNFDNIVWWRCETRKSDILQQLKLVAVEGDDGVRFEEGRTYPLRHVLKDIYLLVTDCGREALVQLLDDRGIIRETGETP